METQNKIVLLVVVADRYGNYRLSSLPFFLEKGEEAIAHRLAPPEAVAAMQKELREEMDKRRINHVANLTVSTAI